MSQSWPENVTVHTAHSPIREMAHGAVRLQESSLSPACHQDCKAAESDLAACDLHSSIFLLDFSWKINCIAIWSISLSLVHLKQFAGLDGD